MSIIMDTRSLLQVAMLLLSLLHLCSSCMERERQALLTFKDSLIDPSSRLSSWVGQDCCKWDGVGCNNKTGHVVELDIFSPNPLHVSNDEGFALVGSSLNPSLAELKHLESLDLFSNNFNGSEIPEFIGNFTKLRYLDLHDANFGGAVPASIGQLSKLEVLDLSDNSLTGVISETHFEKLSRLVDLDLGTTYSMGFFKLGLGTNSLILNVSSNWTPPFQLHSISLRSCSVGPRFPDWLETQSAIRDLDLSNTSISDSIPSWFSNISSNFEAVLFSQNQIHGLVPDLSLNVKMSSSFMIDMSSNHLEGPLPPFPSNTDWIKLSDNFLSGSLPQNFSQMMPKLKYLRLYNNSISGSIPASLCEISELEVISLSHNKLSGEIPRNCWSNLRNRRTMAFTNNNLTGVIPSSNFSGICGLESLRLSKNNFYGEVPSALGNCEFLDAIAIGENQFSGNIAWIGGLTSLYVLSLRSNEFEGTIPPELCHAKYIHILDLAKNKFSGSILPCLMNFTGVYPGARAVSAEDHDSEFGEEMKGRELNYTRDTLKYMAYLDLSSNHLEGSIPKEFTRILELYGLNLSNNLLTGEIPKEIGNLTQLETLDFSNNRLTGRIPQSISNLGFLSYLDLSNNNLSGWIPDGKQLQTFNSSIYGGNPNLCGKQIQKLCAEDEPIQRTAPIKDENFESVGFYISIIIGFLVGFWGVWFALFCKKNWRIGYFRFVENVHDILLIKATQLFRG